jgi:hypothetical protein
MATYFQRPGVSVEAEQIMSAFTISDAHGNTMPGKPADYLITEGVVKEQYRVERPVFERKYMPAAEWRAFVEMLRRYVPADELGKFLA